MYTVIVERVVSTRQTIEVDTDSPSIATRTAREKMLDPNYSFVGGAEEVAVRIHRLFKETPRS